MGTIEDYGEEISASDTDAAKYAGLPDLTELEKMIDWGDIKDRDDLAANLEQNYLDAQDADIKIA